MVHPSNENAGKSPHRRACTGVPACHGVTAKVTPEKHMFDFLGEGASSLWGRSALSSLWSGPAADASGDVSAIDNSDMMGRQAALFTAAEVTGFQSFAEMVDMALVEAGDHPLGTLSVIDHATEGLQEVGNQRILPETLEDPEVREALRRLSERFGPDGALDLHGCHVGAGERGDELLRTLRAISTSLSAAACPSRHPRPATSSE